MRLIGEKVYDGKSTYIDMSADIFCYTKKTNINVDKTRISIDRLERNGYNPIV